MPPRVSLANAERIVVGVVSIPWQMTFNAARYDRELRLPLTPIFLAGLPLLMWAAARRSWARRMLVVVLVYAAFWVSEAPVTRYLLPVLPLYALVTAAAVIDGVGWLDQRRKPSWSPTVVTVVGCAILVASGWLYAVYKVAQWGALPVTAAQRDAFLEQRLPSYDVYRLLNARSGSHYTVYALFDENMRYYADGAFLGDTFGPERYARVTSKLSDSRALFEELRAMGTTYFVVRYLDGPVPLPQDSFFQQHFHLLHQSDQEAVFELVS